MKTNRKLVALGLFSALLAARLAATDYYCDPVNGSPSNSGSSSSPWRRLEEVFSAGKTFANGDTIYLRSGNHGNPQISGGISSGNRTIRAQSGQTPKLRTLRFVSGATRWTVDGVLVSPQEADGSLITSNLVQLDGGATNNVLQNCQIRFAPDAVVTGWYNNDWVNRSGTAVLVTGVNNSILNNQIRNTRNGVQVERVSGGGGTGAIVRGNSVDHFWEDAYRCRVSSCTFEYNRATNSYAVVPPGTEDDPPHRDMFQCYRGDGTFTPVTNVVLRGNVFIARKGTRYPNIPFQYNGKYTIQGLSAFDGPYNNWTIENNVVQVEVGLALAVYGMNDSKIVNNTVVPDPSGTDSEIRIYNQKDGTPSNNIILRNNLAHVFNIWPDTTNLTQSNNLTVGTSYSTYFVDWANFDLHLKAGSPAINAGTTTNAPTIDADQAARSSPYDVGAYEYNAGVIPNAPSGLAASPDDFDMVSLSWTDNSSLETGYKIERKKGTGAYTQIATVGANVTTYTNSSLGAGTGYTYRVRATNASGDSAYSNEAAATTPEITSGRQAHWKLDEGSGTATADSSGNGNNGTLASGPVWQSGRIGSGLKFDGVDDVVNAGSGASLGGLSQITVSAWINVAGVGEGGYGRIIQKGDTASPTAGWRLLTYGTNQLQFSVDYATTDLNRNSAASVFATNTWCHVLATWDGTASATGAKIYVNGVQVAYDASQVNGTGARGADSATQLTLGNTTTGDRSFNGVIDDVRVYNRVLTAAEIAAVYAAGAP